MKPNRFKDIEPNMEWMPDNPCADCRNLKDKVCSGRIGYCNRFSDFFSKIDTQRELLEYLKTQRIHGQTFNEMLKQLEEIR